jgi:hypothetical protein
MSSFTNLGNEKGTKDDPSVPFKVGDQSATGLSSGKVDKVHTYCVHVFHVALADLVWQTTFGTKNASDTSEQRSGEDVKFNTQQEPKGASQVGQKTARESLIENLERGT